MRCRWLLWLVAAELVAQQLHWGVALGGIGSVGISGTAAMLSNPAGLCAQPTRWELALPAAWLRLEGLQLSEYAFYFGGVETPQGWQRRRLSLSERNEFAQLLETHGLEAWLLLQVVGATYRLDSAAVVGVAASSVGHARLRLPRGTVQALQQEPIGTTPVRLEDGESTLRAYSLLTVAYGRRLRWGRPGEFTWRAAEVDFGVALHLYRGHAYWEELPGSSLQLEPVLPMGWDSTPSWNVSGSLRWRSAEAAAGWLGYATGVAPTVGWGGAISLGLRLRWYGSDSLEPALELGAAVEQLGALSWRLTEAALELANDTVRGVLGAAWEEVQQRFTPRRRELQRWEATPMALRLGAQARLAEWLHLPLNAYAEVALQTDMAWRTPQLAGGAALQLTPPLGWLPTAALGVRWQSATPAHLSAGLRWSLAARGRPQVELLWNALDGWLRFLSARRAGIGVRCTLGF